MSKKKNLLSVFTAAVSHVMIILGLNLSVLLVIDVFFNSAMNFLGSDFFRYSCLVFVLCGLYLAVMNLCLRSKEV